MVVKLYKCDPSPPARAAMMATEIFNVPTEMIDVNLMNGDHMKPEMLKINPLHVVPFIVDGDLTVTDSHSILMYLADAYGKDDSLYPKDVKKRALVNSKLFFNAATLFTRLRNVTYFVMLEGLKTMSDQQRKDIVEAYGFMEEFLTRSKFLAGNSMTIADVAAITLATSLQHLVPLDEKKYPKYAAWIKYMEALPFVQKHNKPGSDFLGQALKEKMNL
ncbi:glutathione S-transferase 1-like [Amyelois transitella]|uniref:glutathione S-transferase 1-like n=1 Tax=Amyelois transitella TaxID=680683 RepID=UPI00298FC9C1|nr:glutathione S-transferase 1-like [Amyelois transitella]